MASGPETARSLIFVPGDHPARIEKALASGADGVIIDLEDSVSPAAKPEARDAMRQAVADRDAGRVVVVRINSEPDLMAADQEAIEDLELDGILAAKASVGLLDRLDPDGPPVIALVETAAGIQNSDEIARHPLCCRMMLGSIDLAAEIGIDPRDGEALAPARFKLVVDSAAALIAPPLDGVHTGLKDLDGLAAEAAMAKRMGMSGKALIHPAQIDVVHRVLSPTPEQIAQARTLITTFEKAGASDTGAFEIDGEMIDLAVVKRAQRLLALEDA